MRDLRQTVDSPYTGRCWLPPSGAGLPDDRAADLLAAITVSPQARDR